MSAAYAADPEYVLGTNDDELERLRRQHAVWRPMALEAWTRAGLRSGQHVIDVGCGPGFASFDLADIVGPRGQVVGIERSRRYAEAARTGAASRGLSQLSIVEADLTEGTYPVDLFDIAWMRWVATFLPDPEKVVAHLAQHLKPGGWFVAQEYVDRGTLRLLPTEPAFERFCFAINASWRAAGGDPNAGRQIPLACEKAGLTVDALIPRILVVRPADAGWDWIAAFLETAPARLVELGFLSESESTAVNDAWARASSNSASVVISSLVIEVHARKP